MKTLLKPAALALSLLMPVAAVGNDLEAGFREPPHGAGIRAFWWWLNGNVTKEAITRDLEQMKAKGFNGALIFDADGSGQRGNTRVPAGPVFGGPEWTALFVHACEEARRLDLELSLNIQSGWNLGGPQVSEAEATQRLVWSKAVVEGPGNVELPLSSPVKAGDFYRDITVLAVPLSTAADEESADRDMVRSTVTASSFQPQAPGLQAVDGDREKHWVSQDGPTPEKPQWLLLEFAKPVEFSKWSMFGRKGYGPRAGRIEVSVDGKQFRELQEFTMRDGKLLEAGFAKQAAKAVRVVITDSYDPNPVNGKPRNVQVAEITIPGVTGGVAPGQEKRRPIADLALKSSTRELGMAAPDCRFLLESKPAVPGELMVDSSGIRIISDRMAKDGTVRWGVPAGRWELIRIGHTNTNSHVSTQSEGWGGRVLDYLNPVALDAYWARNIEPLMEAIGPMAGTTLRYIHTDSWEGGGMNWTPGFDGTFRKNRGYDVLPWLAVVAGHVVESREASNAFLADFRKTIGDRVAGHYAHLAELAARHGMGTHPECSGPHAGPLDGLKNYGRSALMMSEFWSPSPHRPTPDHRFYVKQAASAAHTYGKRLVGAEAFTTIGPHWNDTPWSAMKPSFDTEFCAGLNLVFNHTFTCSPEEMGLPGQEYFAGTHFNPQVTWWEESTVFIDYMRRCQFLGQQGRFVADVVHYYGDHIPNVFARKGHDPAGALPGHDYDVLSEELLLSSLAVKDGRLVLPSGMEYRVLSLPDHGVLSLGALEKIDRLVRAGAVVLGPKPLKAVSLEGGAEGAERFRQLAAGLWGEETIAGIDSGHRKVGLGSVNWGWSAGDLLRVHDIDPDVEVPLRERQPNPGIDWIHRRIGDADVYFIAELAGEAGPRPVTFRVAGRVPELWNPVDGSIRQASSFSVVDGRTTLHLRLEAYDSLFVVFRKPTRERDRTAGPNEPTWQELETISAPWTVSFDPEWGGPGKPVRFDRLTDWITHKDPAIRHYSGKAVYRTTLDAPEGDAGKLLALELGEVRSVGIARVTLNGKDLGLTWRPPFRVALGDALKPGKNELEVMVVNSWHNRVMADEDLPSGERVTKTNIRVERKGRFQWKPEPSGLIGPVRLVQAAEVQR